jgi:uncharacterized protein (DUF58 family)
MPPSGPAPLLPPEVRHRLKGLKLRARRADGAALGVHASRNRGAGLEFAQHRAYERGDEPRMVDWKLYARSDRLFVREAERESPLTLWILLDASGSMGQADAARPDWSRLDAAKALAAGLAEMALAGGDRFGWVTLAGDRPHLLPAGAGGRQRDRLWLEMATVQAAGGFPPPPRWTPLWARIGAHDLVVLLSDAFDPQSVDLAGRLAAAGREVLAIRLLMVEERDFPFQGGHRFRDPETGDELPGDGRLLRADFLRRFGEARARIGAELDMRGVRHVEYVLDEPLDLPLRRLFGGKG